LGFDQLGEGIILDGITHGYHRGDLTSMNWEIIPAYELAKKGGKNETYRDLELHPQSRKDSYNPHNAAHQMMKMNENDDTIHLLKILQADDCSFTEACAGQYLPGFGRCLSRKLWYHNPQCTTWVLV